MSATCRAARLCSSKPPPLSSRSPGPPDADGNERLDENLSENGSKKVPEDGRADGYDRTPDQLPPKPLWFQRLLLLAQGRDGAA